MDAKVTDKILSKKSESLDRVSANKVLHEVRQLNAKRKRSHTLAKKHTDELWEFLAKYKRYFTYREFAEQLNCTVSFVAYKVKPYLDGEKGSK